MIDTRRRRWSLIAALRKGGRSGYVGPIGAVVVIVLFLLVVTGAFAQQYELEDQFKQIIPNCKDISDILPGGGVVFPPSRVDGLNGDTPRWSAVESGGRICKGATSHPWYRFWPSDDVELHMRIWEFASEEDAATWLVVKEDLWKQRDAEWEEWHYMSDNLVALVPSYENFDDSFEYIIDDYPLHRKDANLSTPVFEQGGVFRIGRYGGEYHGLRSNPPNDHGGFKYFLGGEVDAALAKAFETAQEHLLAR